MSDLYVPLDPRPDATEITPIDLLRSTEIRVTVPSLSFEEIKTLAIDPESYIIGEIDYTNSLIAANFVVGDTILKVNDVFPATFILLTKLLGSYGDVTVFIKRRAFVTPPGHVRVQAAMTALNLSVQKKMSYMVVTCKKKDTDSFLSTSFGFTAENVNVTTSIKKFVVAEINGNTAADKYFSVGDSILDCCNFPVDNEGKILKQFNMTFQTVGEIDVLIERPISRKDREDSAALIKEHLVSGSSSKSAAVKPIADKKKVGSAAAPVAVAGGVPKDKSSKSAGNSSSSKRRSEKDKLKREKSVDGPEKRSSRSNKEKPIDGSDESVDCRINRKRGTLSDVDSDKSCASPQSKKGRNESMGEEEDDDLRVDPGRTIDERAKIFHARAEMSCIFDNCASEPFKNGYSLLTYLHRMHEGWTLDKMGMEATCNGPNCTKVYGSKKKMLECIDKCRSTFDIRKRKT